MPPTHLGHGTPTATAYVSIYRRIILSQSLTAGLPAKLSWVQLRRQAGGCRGLSAMKIFYVNIIWTICGRNVWRNNSIFSHNSILYKWNGWKLRQFDLHFAPIWVRRRSIADAPGTHWNRSPNVVTRNRRIRHRQVDGIWEQGFKKRLPVKVPLQWSVTSSKYIYLDRPW